MSGNEKVPGSFKQKAKREFIEFWIIAVYLAFFFSALVAYTMLMLRKYDVTNDVMNFGFAIINALVIGKVILVAEMLHLGRGYEKRPLYESVFYKSAVFAVAVLLFHVFEEFVKRVIAGKPRGELLHHLEWTDMAARSLVIFCAFVPLFAFRELRRVIGEEKLYAILRGRGAVEDSAASAGD
jgi:magnesium-transporting ATPase (P-type)